MRRLGFFIRGSARRPWRASFTALIALVLLTRLLWGWHAGRMWEREKEAIRRTGAPATVVELPVQSLEDEDNAALLIIRANQALVPGIDSPSNSAVTWEREGPPYPQNWWSMAAASENAHGQVFALVRQARRYPRAQWTGPLSVQGPGTPYPQSLNLAGEVTRTVCDSAIYHHLRRDDQEAIERLEDVLNIAKLARQDHTNTGQCVGALLDAFAAMTARIIAPGLELPANGQATRPATRQQVQELIVAFLDERDCWLGLRPSIQSERLWCMDTIERDAQSTWIIRPLANYRCIRASRSLRATEEACGKPNFVRMKRRLRQDDVEQRDDSRINDFPRYSRWFNNFPLAYYDNYFSLIQRVLGERRMTAVSLAAQLHRADRGRWPDRLDDLVPAYLASVPEDALTDGQPIGYMLLEGALPNGTDRPLIYMEAGERIEPPDEPVYGWHSGPRNQPYRGDVRQYRDLSRWQPATQPATAPAAAQ